MRLDRRQGARGRIEKDAGLRAGVNVAGGKVTYKAVAESAGTEFTEVEDALALVKRAEPGYLRLGSASC